MRNYNINLWKYSTPHRTWYIASHSLYFPMFHVCMGRTISFKLILSLFLGRFLLKGKPQTILKVLHLLHQPPHPFFVDNQTMQVFIFHSLSVTKPCRLLFSILCRWPNHAGFYFPFFVDDQTMQAFIFHSLYMTKPCRLLFSVLCRWPNHADFYCPFFVGDQTMHAFIFHSL